MKRIHGLDDRDSIHYNNIIARAQHEKVYSLERVWYIACREPSDTPLDRNY